MRLTRRDEYGQAQLASNSTRVAELLECLCRFEEAEEHIGCSLAQMLAGMFADIEEVFTIKIDMDTDQLSVQRIGIDGECKAYWRQDGKTGVYDIWLNGYDGDYVEVPLRLLGYEYFLTQEEAEKALEEGSTGK